MNAQSKSLARKQLDQRLQAFAVLKEIQPPMRGWIRAIRDALGMTGAQLAHRIGVRRQRTAALEKGEVAGTATLNSMKRAAEAMDCVFVYAVVPRDSLAAIVERQACKLAESDAAYTAHTMLLEDQLPNADERRAALDAVVADILHRMPKKLWD